MRQTRSHTYSSRSGSHFPNASVRKMQKVSGAGQRVRPVSLIDLMLDRRRRKSFGPCGPGNTLRKAVPTLSARAASGGGISPRSCWIVFADHFELT